MNSLFHTYRLSAMLAVLLASGLSALSQTVTISRFGANPLEGEPSRKIHFRITRTGSVASSLTVFYATSALPDPQNNAPAAIPGLDYDPFPGSAVIPAGAAEVIIVKDSFTDAEHEAVESIALYLVNPADGSYTVGNPGSAVHILIEATIRISLHNPSVAGNTFTFTVRARSAPITVERAEQLPATTWTALETFDPPLSGNSQRTYTIPPAATAGYYRARYIGSPQINSINVVGMVRVAGPGPFKMISNPLNKGGNLLNDVLALPASAVGSRLHRFNPVTQTYSFSTFQNVSGVLTWTTPPGEASWSPGVGAHFESKINGASGPVNLVFVGDVPQGDSLVSIPGSNYTAMVSSVPPLTAPVGYPGASGNTLGFPAINNDRVLIFDDATQSYVTYTFLSSLNRWTGAAGPNGLVVPAGTSFWTQRSGAPGSWAQSFLIFPPGTP